MLPTGDPLGTVVITCSTPLRSVLTVWLSILPALGVGGRPARRTDSPSEGVIDVPSRFRLVSTPHK